MAGVDTAIEILKASKKTPKFLFEQNRNLGDTLHLIPIIRHYRLLNPDAIMVMLVAQTYANAWAYNEDVNSVITIPSLNPQLRIKLRRRLLNHQKNINIIAPSIFPYGEVWKELKWSHANIADQYLDNAGIKDLTPKGGRRLIIGLDDSDKKWAAGFASTHGLNRKNSVGFEYHSYSHQPPWKMKEFKQLANMLKKQGFKCVSIAGPKEPLISGTINGKGINWRRTAALMNHLGVFCGVGSGLTMVAAAAEHQPQIIELAVSNSITMKSCGYANSWRLTGKNPAEAAALVRKALKS
jgi:ADP-heptose:LPS heptosyltransferase